MKTAFQKRTLAIITVLVPLLALFVYVVCFGAACSRIGGIITVENKSFSGARIEPLRHVYL